MKIVSFGGTDTGKKRANNEDAYLLNDELCLYAVADGVGGSEGGEIASRMAVETLAASMPDLLGGKDRTPPSGVLSRTDPETMALAYALTLANRTILAEQSNDPGHAGMATTLTALLLRKGRMFLAHIGDSRMYLLRSGMFTQLTRDHSFVEEQVRAGALTSEQARTSPYRHVITRALGTDAEAKADLTSHALQRDDRLLLCTDGLTGVVDDADISTLLSRAAPREAVRKLLAAANDGGGIDNITAVVIWVTEI
jgi:serine/threonine protein phosphatase PrpC